MQKSFIYQEAIISYRIEGKGDPVILLHGFGEDSHIWDLQIAFLKEHCLLIIPDLPGSGKSSLLSIKSKVKSQKLKVTNDHPPSNIQHQASNKDVGENTNIGRKSKEQSQLTPDSTLLTSDYIAIDDYANCIHAVLQEEKISSCTMLGHSMGGYITLAFAEKYPSVLNGFGLIHSTAFADSEEKKKIREKAISFIAQYGAHSFLKSAIPNLFGPSFKKEQYAQIDTLINSAATFTKEALQQYYRAMIMRPDRRAVLQSNPLPVLFVIGGEDMAVPMDEILQQTSLPKQAYIHILPDSGHMSMWEATKELNRFILAFIQK